jgi:hypothetical protein
MVLSFISLGVPGVWCFDVFRPGLHLHRDTDIDQ